MAGKKLKLRGMTINTEVLSQQKLAFNGVLKTRKRAPIKRLPTNITIDNLERSLPIDMATTINARPQSDKLKIRTKRLIEAGWELPKTIRPIGPHLPRLELPALQPTRLKPILGKPMLLENDQLVVIANKISIRLARNVNRERGIAEAKNMGAIAVHQPQYTSLFLHITLPDDQDPLEATAALEGQSWVSLAEPILFENYEGRSDPSETRRLQDVFWYLFPESMRHGLAGLPNSAKHIDVDINIAPVWKKYKGTGQRIAIIDNGFYTTQAGVSAAVGGLTGVIDEGEDGPEWRTVSLDDDDGLPEVDHGTFCASIAGCRPTDDNSPVGIAYDSELALLAIPDFNASSQAGLAHALGVASMGDGITEGADVISCSLGPNGAGWLIMTELQEAIENAATNGRDGKGTPIFWACANVSGNDLMADQVTSHHNVMAVRSINAANRPEAGPHGPALDLLAPGASLWGFGATDNPIVQSGNSFAAPLAAGVATLMIQAKPDISATAVFDNLRGSAEDQGGFGIMNASQNLGRLDALAAVKCCDPNVDQPQGLIDLFRTLFGGA